jgi:hypothetical protein
MPACPFEDSRRVWVGLLVLTRHEWLSSPRLHMPTSVVKYGRASDWASNV